MGRPQNTPGEKQHFLVEWAEVAQMTQADIVRAMNEGGLPVDKGTVSRWFKGSMPSKIYRKPLSDVLGLREEMALYRHPDDEWMARFLRGRSADEKFRIRQMLEAAFPIKKAG